MTFPTPSYSREQVKRAGIYLVENEDIPDIDDNELLVKWFEAHRVLTNWRACHSYPINTFQSTLRQKLRAIDGVALVAQRLKRTPSIIKKLKRFPSMSLSRMQDIGGLRAVVSSLSQLKDLYANYKATRFTHALVSEHDYVANPKSSGYRSVHLVYKYKLRVPSPYEGLQVELQFRTKLQHAWATAVETVGTFLEHSLKSSEGPDEWLNFFSLVSSAFAHTEGTTRVPGYEHMDKAETYQRTASEAARLGVNDLLRGYSSVVKAIPTGATRSAYYLVELQLSGDDRSVNITPFARDKLEEANIKYSEAEQRSSPSSPMQVVLVSAGSIESLKRAYPNYFLDTHEFLSQLEKITKSKLALLGQT